MRVRHHGTGQGRFWLTVWSACALLPLALGWGRYLAVLCVLPVIGTFACLQGTGRGSYARAALRCFGFAWGVLSLLHLGLACRRSCTGSPLLSAGEVLGHYGRSLPRLALLSLLAGLLGLVVVGLAHLRRQRRGQPCWYTTPLASDPHLRCQYRCAGDASLIFGCLVVYFTLWLRHQETLLRQAAPFFGAQTVHQQTVHHMVLSHMVVSHPEALLRQASPAFEDLLMARIILELPYDALVAGFTGVLLLYTARVAIRTRQRLPPC